MRARLRFVPIFSVAFAIVSLLLSPYAGLHAATTTPATINYQGRLLNSSSNPLSGNYTFRFSLWQSADWVAGDTTGGGAINTGSVNYAGWQEAHALTTGTFGLFNMSLGSTTSFPNFDANTHKFLQVEVKATGAADTTYEILDPQGTTADTVDRKTIHDQAYAENADLAGYTDWRLPNVKELQSIVDYTRSPSATDAANVGPAISTMFNCTPIVNEAGDDDYGYYWTSTSANFTSGEPYYYAWYVAFGRAVNGEGEDYHGAGGVRFDTKYEGGPLGEGGERYYNYIRLVRNISE